MGLTWKGLGERRGSLDVGSTSTSAPTLTPLLEHDRCALFYGDSKHLADVLPENSIDAVVTDPPAGIRFMGKSWDGDRGGRDQWVEWLADLMKSAFRVLKPGGYALVWAIPRTSHWTAWALEDAGFEIRDVHHDMIAVDEALQDFLKSLDDIQRAALVRILESQSSPILYQVFGNGFPKSMDLAREYDMHVCAQPGRHYDKSLPKGAKAQPGDHLCPAAPDREKYAGRTALKPAVEHWIMARKPLDGTVIENVVKYGTGRLNVDGCRIEGGERPLREHTGRSGNVYGDGLEGSRAVGETTEGRWPAHVSLDETTAAIMDEQSGTLKSGTGAVKRASAAGYEGSYSIGKESRPPGTPNIEYGDSGGASRFYYVAKAPRKEKEAGLEHLTARTGGEATGREDGSAGLTNPRAGAGRTGGAKNHHPTVKSVALMRWLCRLVTPPGGVILDPFAGSGSTGVAALAEGFSFIGCELGGEDGEYLPIVVGRLRHALGLPPEAPEATLAAIRPSGPEESSPIVKGDNPSAGFSGLMSPENTNTTQGPRS